MPQELNLQNSGGKDQQSNHKKQSVFDFKDGDKLQENQQNTIFVSDDGVASTNPEDTAQTTSPDQTSVPALKPETKQQTLEPKITTPTPHQTHSQDDQDGTMMPEQLTQTKPPQSFPRGTNVVAVTQNTTPVHTLDTDLGHKNKQGFFSKLIAGLQGKTSTDIKPVAVKIAAENSLDDLVLKPINKLTTKERSKLREAEEMFEKGATTILDILAPSGMRFDPARYLIDSTFAQSFFIYDYPHFLEMNWLSPVVNMEASLDISMFIYPRDSADIMKFLRRKVTQLAAEMSLHADKGMTRDPYIEAKYKDAEELRNKLVRGSEHFFSSGLYITIYTTSEAELKTTTKKLQSLLGGRLILSKPTFLQMERGFNSTIPVCTDQLGIARSMNTEPLSSMFPFASSSLTSDEGILYGINRHNDSLIIFDRFKLANANSVVLATSGAGKSYAVKLEILRSLMWGADVIVIDPENEYEDLCKIVGGSYLQISLAGNHHINPFDLPKPLAGIKNNTGDVLRSNIINLHGLLALILNGVSAPEQGILDKALIQTYALKGITFTSEDPFNFTPPIMADLRNVLDSMANGRDLAIRLDKYVDGAYSGFFSGQTNIDINATMVVFCVRDLEEQLRPIAMYMVLGYIWNIVRAELKKRILVVDEAWNILQHDDSGLFLYGLIKRARKYYLGVTTITQDVEDFMNSKYGKPIVTNSAMNLLLKQSPSAIEALNKIFRLTEGERKILISSGIGQGIFFAGDKHVAIQIIASFNEDKIITTNPEEILIKANLEEESI